MDGEALARLHLSRTKTSEPLSRHRSKRPERPCGANECVIVTDNERDFVGIEIIDPIRGAR